MSNDRRPWYAAVTAATLLFGTSPLIVRTVALPASAIAFSRVLVAAVALGSALALGIDRRPDAPHRPALLAHRPLRTLATAATLGFHWLALFGAFKRAPAATVILIVYMAPVAVAALAPRVLGERHGRRTYLALAIAVAGLAFVAGPGARGASRGGLLMATASALLFVALVLLSKPLAERYGGIRLTFIEMAGASLVLLPGAAGAEWGEPEAAWLWLVVLGLVHTALATGVYLTALAHLPATHVGVISYVEPASVAFFAWAVLGESLSAWTIMGGVLVVFAGALVATARPIEVERVPG